MHTRILAPAFFSLILASSGSAFAVAGKIAISAPANGSTVGQDDDVEITYEAARSPDGDHLHLYLDNKRVDVLHEMKGKADVGILPPGKHHVCLAENNSGHIPTGVETCIDLISK